MAPAHHIMVQHMYLAGLAAVLAPRRFSHLAFVLRFLLLFLDRAVDSPHGLTDCRRWRLEAGPLFQLTNSISNEPELSLLQSAESCCFALSQGRFYVFELNHALFHQVVSVCLLDIAIDLLWIQIRTARHHTIPHQGWLPPQPLA